MPIPTTGVGITLCLSPLVISSSMSRDRLLRRAIALSALSIVLSGILGVVAVAAGLASNRLSLLGFGFDAAIDSVASVVLL